MKKCLSVILITAVMVSFTLPCVANDNDIEGLIAEVSVYLKEKVTLPTVSSIGGEWSVIGLARSGDADERFFSDYYAEVKSYTENRGGILHKKKYTEYSRVVVALTAIGKNPTDVSGYNLLLPLADFKQTVWQGINGAVWALIAFDCGNYEIPEIDEKERQATRERYIEYLLEKQKTDGGWSLSEKEDISEVDITAMVIYALSRYRNNERVKASLDKALLLLEVLQGENGGFQRGGVNSESPAQVLTALCSLGISYNDPRFVKNGKTVLDDLLSYYSGGGFKHLPEGKENIMATEQALCALAALKRFQKNMPDLYEITDPLKLEESPKNITVQKNRQVQFKDVSGHKNEKAIKELAARSIINGKSDACFEPESTMTRAEFATIIVKALNLKASSYMPFSDVEEADWFYEYVNAAYENKIISGISETKFNPAGTVTRQEAAVMICRSAKTLGLNTDMDLTAARNILAGFTDYVKTASWAIKELAYCCDKGIIDDAPLEILPEENVQRGEIAQMIFELLKKGDRI